MPQKHNPLQWMSCFTLHQFVIVPKIHNVDFWINCFVFCVFKFILIVISFALKCHKKSQRVEASRSTVPANLKVIQSIILPRCGLDAESLYMTLNLNITRFHSENLKPDLQTYALVVADTQFDSIQCLNFAKKWFIQYSIQYCFTQDSIQNINQLKKILLIQFKR